MSGEAGVGEKEVEVYNARTQGPRTDSKYSTSVGWDGVISELRFGGRYDSNSVV